MTHDWDETIGWCKCCGRSAQDICNSILKGCRGVPGTMHIAYMQAKRNYLDAMDPILRSERKISW